VFQVILNEAEVGSGVIVLGFSWSSGFDPMDMERFQKRWGSLECFSIAVILVPGRLRRPRPCV